MKRPTTVNIDPFPKNRLIKITSVTNPMVLLEVLLARSQIRVLSQPMEIG